ncbi:MAG: hypothetical protein R3236_01140, partial [Phycisphaeraceae bacterium]|nr:hypothetical protein [Phycisphaeraceae bacterium]
DITDLYHKCLAASAGIHLLLLFLLMFWLIAQELDGGEQQSPETALLVDSLAEEELAMESEQPLAEVAHSTQLVVSKNVQEFREMAFKPQEVVANPVPVPRRTSDQSLVTDFKPSKASESDVSETVPLPQTDAPVLKELASTELPELQVEQLEVADQTTAEQVVQADPTEDEFRLDEEVVQQVQTQQAQLEQARAPKLLDEAEAESVAASTPPAPAKETGGQTVNPVDGLEADGSPPELEGTRQQQALAMNLPGNDPADSLAAGVKLETPEHKLDAKALSKYIKKQRGVPSLEVIEQLGGSDETERAIGLALDWFTDHQEPDGHWDMAKHGGKGEYNTAGTGFALLCYYGWGIKHGDESKHAKAVSRAIDWLLKQQKDDGDLRGAKSSHGMYCHGIAAIALCEAYGLTKDPKLKEPAERAIEFIVNAQHKAGGWRYKPGQSGDLSVTGWQYMALHSARMAEIQVDESVFEKTRQFIDSVSGGKQGGLYGYTGPAKGRKAMTATGMFLRQLDLTPPTDPKQQESARFIKANMLKAGKVDFYYDYYATLSLYQHQGPVWRQWNDNLKEVYVALQKKTGSQKGSWEPKGAHMKAGGRVVSTALAVLSLEVYYRLLPMYGFAREER